MPWQPETTPFTTASRLKEAAGFDRSQLHQSAPGNLCGLYAWEFERGGRELKVRVDGQLVFNGTAQMLNAAQAEFDFGVYAGRCGAAAFGSKTSQARTRGLVPTFPGISPGLSGAAATPHRLLLCWLMRCVTAVDAALLPEVKFSMSSSSSRWSAVPRLNTVVGLGLEFPPI